MADEKRNWKQVIDIIWFWIVDMIKTRKWLVLNALDCSYDGNKEVIGVKWFWIVDMIIN